MSSDEPKVRESSTDRLPHKPTRESAIGSTDPDQVTGQRSEPAGMPASEELGETRQEVGTAADSQRHPPHVASSDADAPVQDELPSPDAVPVLPANAAGSDKITAEEQDEPIDEESMYEGRPERDKDRPPSERGN
jgi:hypothetical protein